jgi:hypothetical protein
MTCVDMFAAIRVVVGYTVTQLIEISSAIAMAIFPNTFNCMNDRDLDFAPVK